MINTISKVKSIIPENCDGVLITNPSDMVYLTDLVGIEGFIIVTRDKATLYTDGRYIETAEKNIDFMNIALLKSGVNVNTASKENRCKRVCCQGDISAFRFNTLNQNGDVSFGLNGQFDGMLSNLRMVKTDREISRMKRAQEITDMAFAHALKTIKVGMSERELAAELDYFMRKNGSDGTAFDTIAISGENTSLPHGIPTDRKIQNGDFVTMDFGATVKGVKSDMTRTVGVGSVDNHKKEVYNIVLKAQTETIFALKAGLSCKDADAIARDVIEREGYGEYFTHSTGHGVGFDIHEAPTLSPNSTDILREYNVVTVEPGIYLPSKFGVRIEDFGVITKNGFENFTKSPKELIVL